jgi:hypothetical protein
MVIAMWLLPGAPPAAAERDAAEASAARVRAEAEAARDSAQALQAAARAELAEARAEAERLVAEARCRAPPPSALQGTQRVRLVRGKGRGVSD